MGLFTRSKDMSAADRMAAADRWALIGATLQDVGSAATGGQGGAIQGAREMMRRRAGQADLASLFSPQQPAMMGGQAGPDAMPAGPQQPLAYTSPSLSDPATVQKLASLMNRGVNIKDALELLKASDASRKVEVANGVTYNPFQTAPGSRIGVNLQNVNGAMVDPNDPSNVNRYVPKLEDGAEPLYDRQGNVVGQRLLDGTTQAIGARAAAQSGGQSAGSAPYDLATIQSPQGGVISGSRADILGMGPVQGQTPVQAKAAEATLDAQMALPQSVATAQQTLDLIGQLRTHPGREMATGMSGILPAVPGTPTKDFVDLLDQARGQTFLSAYNQLKGGGAITEMEGKKAEQAIARLGRTQSQQGFLTALSDLESVIKSGISRSQAKASGATSGSYRAPPPAAVQYLRNNPAMRQAFDAKYGQGSAARVLGQ